MKNYQNHRHAGRNRRQAAGRLSRMEDKLNIIIAGLNRINARVQTIERQQRGEFTDAAINRLRDAAVHMGEMTVKELQAIKERYGSHGI